MYFVHVVLNTYATQLMHDWQLDCHGRGCLSCKHTYTCILPDVKPQDNLLYYNIQEDRNGNSHNQIYQQATYKNSKFCQTKTVHVDDVVSDLFTIRHICWVCLVSVATVEPLNKGRFGSRAFVLFLEVVLWWKVQANMQFIAPSRLNIPRQHMY